MGYECMACCPYPDIVDVQVVDILGSLKPLQDVVSCKAGVFVRTATAVANLWGASTCHSCLSCIKMHIRENIIIYFIFRKVTKNRKLAHEHMMLECNLKLVGKVFLFANTSKSTRKSTQDFWSSSRPTYYYRLGRLWVVEIYVMFPVT